MTNSIRVYVPKAVESSVKNEVCEYFAEKLGGFTQFEAKGGWKSDTGEIVQEPVDVIESVTDTNQPAKTAKTAARMVKQQSDEDAVMWDIRPIEIMGME